MNQVLWHVSDQADITVFRPRAPPSTDAGVNDAVVWAVADSRLPNYLVPRDCPRVCFWNGNKMTVEDRVRFLGGGTSHVVTIETTWMSRVLAATLYLYELPAETFSCADANAGYFVSRKTVTPLGRHIVSALPGAIERLGARLRTEHNLRGLGSQVAASTLSFSLIRMRNASASPNAG